MSDKVTYWETLGDSVAVSVNENATGVIISLGNGDLLALSEKELYQILRLLISRKEFLDNPE